MCGFGLLGVKNWEALARPRWRKEGSLEACLGEPSLAREKNKFSENGFFFFTRKML